MKSMTLEDLEEVLDDIFPNGFQIETDDDGQIIVCTNLTEDEDGNLVPLDEDCDESDEEDSDFESYDESSDDDL
jgi:hypothetical protein